MRLVMGCDLPPHGDDGLADGPAVGQMRQRLGGILQRVGRANQRLQLARRIHLRKVSKRFAQQLQPGGYLYIGHSERVLGPALELLESVGPTIYRRRLA